MMTTCKCFTLFVLTTADSEDPDEMHFLLKLLVKVRLDRLLSDFSVSNFD